MKYTSCKICDSAIHEENKTLQLVKCASCGITFYGNDLSDIDLDAYYKGVYESDYKNYGKAAANMSEGNNQTIGYNKAQIMSRILKDNPGSIVEFGAGVGIIANFLKNKHVPYQGFELVANVVAESRRQGLNIEQGDFTVLGNHKNQFNTVLAFEVIEHIDNLKLCLGLVHGALQENGRFGFTVPNYNKRLNYPHRGDSISQIGPPVHVNFFTMESIKNMAPLFGFKVEYIAERSFPQRQKKTKEFLRLILRKLTGKFHGPNIYCILRK
jgi:2-polyprenyl-3-methyl-5-hydroxy-6-metoxy-1,4-benzoquinol methylase